MPPLFRTSSHRIWGSMPTIQLGYIAEFKGQTWTLYARSKDEAHTLACNHFKARRTQHRQVQVRLADRNWSPL